MDQIGPSAEEPVGGWASSAGDFVKRAPAHAHAAPRKRAACYVVTLTFNRPRTYIPSSLRLGAHNNTMAKSPPTQQPHAAAIRASNKQDEESAQWSEIVNQRSKEYRLYCQSDGFVEHKQCVYQVECFLYHLIGELRNESNRTKKRRAAHAELTAFFVRVAQSVSLVRAYGCLFTVVITVACVYCRACI